MKPCRHCAEAIEPGPTGGWMDADGFLNCQRNLPHEPTVAPELPSVPPQGCPTCGYLETHFGLRATAAERRSATQRGRR
jgi:hypothetical protein